MSSSLFPMLLGNRESNRKAQVPSNEYRELVEKRVQSWAAYAAASSLERRCVFAVVARTSHADLEPLRSAFADVDADCDGRISRRDLQIALNLLRDVEGNRPSYAHFDANSFFLAADLDSSGSLDFHEFASACLHSQLAPLDSWLVDEAFKALDTNQEGKLHAFDVQRGMGEVPAGLPARRYFGPEEWRHCLLGRSLLPPPTPADKKRAAAAPARHTPSAKTCQFEFFEWLTGCTKGIGQAVATEECVDRELTEPGASNFGAGFGLTTPFAEQWHQLPKESDYYGYQSYESEWRIDSEPQRRLSERDRAFLGLSSATYVPKSA